MQDRVTKTIKLGEQQGCMLNDRVSIEFSPSECQDLSHIFEEKSLEASSYIMQGINRGFCKAFDDAFNMWKRERRERVEEASDGTS